MGRSLRSPLVTATLLGLGLLLAVLLSFALLGRLFGREAEAAWVCGDTRYTQLVPRGFGVVGPPVSPPPGCLP